MYDLRLSNYDKAMYLDSARLCALWISNNQNIADHPWGSVIPAEQSADYGRFIEKVHMSRSYCRPAGVWLTGIYLSALIDMQATPVLDSGQFVDAISYGQKYLKSLQCFDCRWPGAIGGFHETKPGCPYSAPRDAASGALGLIALYQYTGDEEYSQRSVAFAEWYSSTGSDSDGYPWDDFDLSAGEGTSRVRGDWQSGGALVYYQLWKITGDKRWKNALLKVCDTLITICENDPGTDTPYVFHGDCVISHGNDDFATTALFAAYVASGKEKYRDLGAKRIRNELGRQAKNGAFPGYGGTTATAVELIEALDLASAGYEILPAEEIEKPLRKAVDYSLSLQERTNHDRMLMGGIYGQSNFSTSSDIVHGRDVVYAINLFLRLAGYRASAYSVLGWDKIEYPSKHAKNILTVGNAILEMN